MPKQLFADKYFLKKHSLKKTIIRYAVVMVIVFLLSSFFTVGSLYRMLQDSVFTNVRQTMDLYNSQLNANLTQTRSTLINYSYNNYDLLLMSFKTAPSDQALSQIKVSNLIKLLLPGLPSTDGIFFYTKETDCYVADSKRNIDPCISYLKDQLRGGDINTLVQGKKWTLVQLGNEHFLINVSDLTSCYAGAWVELDTLAEAFSSLDTNTLFVYTDANGQVIGNPEMEHISFSPSDSLSNPVTVEYLGEEYLQVSTALDFCDYYLIALIPTSSFYRSIRPLTRMLILIVVLFMVFMLVNLYFTDWLFARPIKDIRKASAHLTRKDLHAQLPIRPNEYEEIQSLLESINGLVDQITNLQKDVYQESLNKTEFELQYLKSQVAPHFLINCFSTIGSIPDTPDGKQIRQRMIQTLSDHLRYTLGRQKNVVLEDELYYVENYITLTNIRFPDCLRYNIDVDDECMDAAVFPLLILMLTENSIKYNMVMGELLEIKISCHLKKDSEGSTMLHITHIDSGSGYPEPQLEIMNHMDGLDTNPSVDGHRIGIFNIVKRVSLIYGTSASIHFSNEPGMGARCDIIIPYIAADLSEDEF